MLEKLKELKEDMVNNDWTICSFLFRYKSVEYIVLVKRFAGTIIRKNKYALVLLHFMKSNNLEDEIILEANTNGLLIDAKTLREYFGISYCENLGDILKQFIEHFSKYIPSSINLDITNIEKNAMIRSLSISDSQNPNKIYCTKVKRNKPGEFRTSFNSDKTKLLRPMLFNYFKDDKNISFCYSDDINDEKSDNKILKNFSLNKTKG